MISENKNLNEGAIKNYLYNIADKLISEFSEEDYTKGSIEEDYLNILAEITLDDKEYEFFKDNFDFIKDFIKDISDIEVISYSNLDENAIELNKMNESDSNLYLKRTAHKIVFDEWLDEDDLNNPDYDVDELINNAIDVYVREEILPIDKIEGEFIDNNKDMISIYIKDLLNLDMMSDIQNINIDEDYNVPKIYDISEAYSRKLWTISRVESEILEPIANELNHKLYKGKREKQDTFGRKYISQFYNIGDVTILVRAKKDIDNKVDDAVVWVLDKNKLSVGTKFNPILNYSGLKEKIKDIS